MKKILLLGLCLLLLFSFAACASNQLPADDEQPALVSCKLADAGLEPGASAADLIIAYCRENSIAYTSGNGMYDNFYGRASTDSEGWLLYIDDVLAELGAEAIPIDSPDTLVEFRYMDYAEAFPEFY